MKISYDVGDIIVIENILEPTLCERLIRLFNIDNRKSQCKTEDHGKQKYREASTIVFHEHEDWHELFEDDIKPRWQEAVEMYQDYYEFNKPWVDYGATLAHYKPGEGCHFHVDGMLMYQDSGRVATSTIALNDGSPIHFPRQDASFAPNPGSGIFFPCGYTHVHGVPKCDEDRYVLLNWWFQKGLQADARLTRSSRRV